MKISRYYCIYLSEVIQLETLILDQLVYKKETNIVCSKVDFLDTDGPE